MQRAIILGTLTLALLTPVRAEFQPAPAVEFDGRSRRFSIGSCAPLAFTGRNMANVHTIRRIDITLPPPFRPRPELPHRSTSDDRVPPRRPER